MRSQQINSNIRIGAHRLFARIALLTSCLVGAGISHADLADTPVDWSNFSYVSYTFGGGLVTDSESSSDPSNGGAAVAPDTLDIASCSADGALPGTDSSTRISYYDADGDSVTLGDAYLAFGIRIDGNPLNAGGSPRGYRNNHWNILIDIDNDGYKEFVLDLDGNSGTGPGPDRFFLRYNNLDTQEVFLPADHLEEWWAAGPNASPPASTNNHTRVEISPCGSEDDYWLDLQIPLTALSAGGMQLVFPSTPVRIFYSTSASSTDPLQKDWMMDPGGLGGGAFMLSDPIIFGDTFSGTGGVVSVPPGFPPVAVDDLAATDPGDAVTIDVLANDSDPDGNVLTISAVSDPANGTAAIDTKGTPNPLDDEITYTPDTGFMNGVDSFTYTVDDGSGNTATATVSVTVPASTADVSVDMVVDNATPQVGETVAFTITVSNDGPADATVQVTDLLPSGYSYMGDTGGGTYDSSSGTWTAGTVSAGSPEVLTITATVNASGDYTNTATITGLDVADPNPANNAASVSTTPNSQPIAVDDLAATDPGDAVTIDVLANDSDPDGNVLTISAVSDPANGTAAIDTKGTPNPLDDEITYTPDTGFMNGVDSFTYTVDDGNGGTATATVEVTVPASTADVSVDMVVDNATPQVGEAITFTITVSNDGPADTTVQVTDLLPSGYSYVGDTGGGTYDSSSGTWTAGTVSSGSPEVLTITATVNGSGDYTNTATITGLDVADPNPANNAASVSTTPNSQPIAVDDLAATDPGDAITIDVLANDSDPDGNVLTISAVSDPANGTAAIDTKGTPNPLDDEITYTPDTGFMNGVDSFTYTVDDGSGGTATATVEVTVPASTADVSVDMVVDNATPQVGETVAFTITVSNDGPADTTVQVTDLLPSGYSYVGDTGGGTYDSSSGTWTAGTVSSGSPEVLTITATVNGSGDYTNTATITGLDVADPNPANNAASVSTTPNSQPMAVDDLAGTDPGDAVTIDVLANDSDPDGNVLTISAVSDPANGTAAIDTKGTPNPLDDEITYTPDTGFMNGVDSFTYTVDDGNGGTATATVEVTVPLSTTDVSVDMVVDNATPQVGETVAFTITVSNEGPADATVQVTDLLPSGYSYVGDTGGGTYDSSSGTWTAGTVSSGSPEVLTITATVNGSGDYTNTATITGLDVADPNPANNAASVSTTPNSQPMAVDDLAGTDPGDAVTIDVLANDSDPDGNVLTISAVSDPANGTAAIDTKGTPNPLDDEITYTPDTGFMNGVDSFTYTVDDGNGGTATATVEVTVPLSTTDVSVDMVVDNATPQVGETVAFTITVSNEGPADATVQVTDLLPSGYSYVGDTGGGTYDSSSGTWTAGTVSSGSPEVLTITATVNGSGDYTNTATITGLDVDDPDLANNESSITIELEDLNAPVEPAPIPMFGIAGLLSLAGLLVLIARRQRY